MAELTVKVGNLVEAQRAINNILTASQPTPDNPMPKRIPATAAYWLQKAARVIMEESTQFEKARLALIERLGFEKSEDGTRFNIPPERAEEWSKEYLTLLDVETEVHLRKVALADVVNLELTPADMWALDWLIEAGDG